MNDETLIRLARGAAAVEAGSDNDHPQTDAIDTITNVLHWLRSERPEFDARRICETAISHFMVEVAEEAEA